MLVVVGEPVKRVELIHLVHNLWIKVGELGVVARRRKQPARNLVDGADLRRTPANRVAECREEIRGTHGILWLHSFQNSPDWIHHVDIVEMAQKTSELRPTLPGVVVDDEMTSRLHVTGETAQRSFRVRCVLDDTKADNDIEILQGQRRR